MEIYLLRHGQTESNLHHLYNVNKDEPVTEAGLAHLTTLNYPKADKYFVSPLPRCMQTFDVLFENEPITQVMPSLVEMDFGAWAGKSYLKIIQALGDLGFTWDDFVNPPQGEKYDDFFARTSLAFKEIVSQSKESDRIVILCHGYVISSIMYNCICPEVNFYHHRPKNGQGYLIKMTDGKIESYEEI